MHLEVIAMKLKGRTVGITVAPGFDDTQVVEAAQLLRKRGAKVVIISTGESEVVAVAGMRGSLLKPDTVISKSHPSDFDAIIIPGGDAPARLKADVRVLTLLLGMSSQQKPLGAVFNGPVVLAAAGLLSERRVTGDSAIKGELENAGARFVSQGVVVDHNLVTCGTESDLTHFVDAVLFLLEPATTLS